MPSSPCLRRPRVSRSSFKLNLDWSATQDVRVDRHPELGGIQLVRIAVGRLKYSLRNRQHWEICSRIPYPFPDLTLDSTS
jgi:hypothetical protein